MIGWQIVSFATCSRAATKTAGNALHSFEVQITESLNVTFAFSDDSDDTILS